MAVTTSRPDRRLPALLADPVTDPDPGLATARQPTPGVPATCQPVVTPDPVRRAEVRALRSRIAELESRLAVAERRRLHTIDRYESILDRRTETFRRWVDRGDPRPEEFEWVGESDRVTADPTPDLGGDERAVATDGGRTAGQGDGSGSGGLVARFVRGLRALVGRCR